MTDGADMFPVRGKATPRIEGQKVLALRAKAALLVEQPACEHEWKLFKQTIEQERTPSQEAKGYFYKRGRAYFIVKGCIKCHIKRNINMRIEP